MKLHASRDDRDLDDAAILYNTLGYTSAQECIDLLTDTYPLAQLLPRHRYLAEEVATRARGLHEHTTADDPTADARKATHLRERAINDSFDPFSDPFGSRPRRGRNHPEPPTRGL